MPPPASPHLAIYDHIILPMLRGLDALSAILAKAKSHCESQGIDQAALLNARLFPDMLPFTRQVQLVADFTRRGPDRLCGRTTESVPDTETSFAELRARLASARAYNASFTPADFEGAATREVILPLRSGERLMSGIDFLTGIVLPNFYFHMATAYDLLRHNGVVIGKADFLGA